MTEPLLTISAFARAVELAPSTLRYYDEAGLLPPTEILDGIADRAQETARRTAEAAHDVIAALRPQDAKPGPAIVRLDGAEFATALRRVSTAASTESEVLGVVLVDVTAGGLTTVATDRYWMATSTIPLADGGNPQRRFAIPLADVPELADWLGRQLDVTLSCSQDNVRLLGPERSRTVQTAADRFPAYRLLFEAADTSRGRVTVDRQALLRAVCGELDPIRMRMGTDRLVVAPHDAAEGVHLPGTVAGEPLVLGFSPTLLGRVLSAMVGTEVSMSYEAADRAVRVTSPDQHGFTALVMPFTLDTDG